MSRSVFQPVGQKRLTNIAVVRLKKNGKRFEIACYKNKVGDWRAGIEKDLDEVLQTMAIFNNVGKGILAKKEDLVEVFGTTDDKTICMEILARGELQVSDKERKVDHDNQFKDMVNVLVEKCINPDTQRPYTFSMLSRALKEIHFNPDPKKNAKQLALEALPLLQEQFPIQRAKMRLKLQVPTDREVQAEKSLTAELGSVGPAMAAGSGEVYWCVEVDPGCFRSLHNVLAEHNGRVEVLSLAVTHGGTGEDFSSIAGAAGPQTRMDPQDGHQYASSQTTSTATTTAPAPTSPSHHVVPRSSPGGPRTPSRKLGGQPEQGPQELSGAVVVFPKGPIMSLPEEHLSRRERFAELDNLQAGWQVELRSRGGGTVDAVFFSPEGQEVGAFAAARRMALQASRQQVG